MKIRKDCRLILDLQQLDIYVFEEFGRYNYDKAQPQLPLHTHGDAIEICYLSRGNQIYCVNDKMFRIKGGEVFIAYPNEVHSTGIYPEEKGVLYWFILRRPNSDQDYLGLSFFEASNLFFRLEHLSKRVFPVDIEIEQLLQRIIHVYFSTDETLRLIEMKNLLINLFLRIIYCGERNTKKEVFSKPILDVIAYIDNNIFEIFDLENLANRCCLSLSRFKHRFKEEVGMPPIEFITRKKLERACLLLEENKMSIKDIAYELGFSSPSYFSSVFKQYLGYSPTYYKIKCS